MHYLADTHILLWWLEDHPRLPQSIKELLADSTNIIYFSTASAWEISIKAKTKKLPLKTSLETVFANIHFDHLTISLEHILQTEKLPLFHTDPFDRMLIAQAKVENLKFITADKKIWQYDLPLVKVQATS